MMTIIILKIKKQRRHAYYEHPETNKWLLKG
jgi:hypothetical protein